MFVIHTEDRSAAKVDQEVPSRQDMKLLILRDVQRDWKRCREKPGE